MATDIAARGIDINKLQFVINYDIPNLPETYVHRIGRSGRAGENGIAISICEPEENIYIKDIQKLIGDKIKIESENPFPQTDKPMTDAEKKEWNKEKQRRKQEFFANRNKNKRSKNGGNKNQKKSENSKTHTTDDRRIKSKDDSANRSDSKDHNRKNRNQKSKPKKSGGRYTKDLPDSLREKFMFPLE